MLPRLPRVLRSFLSLHSVSQSNEKVTSVPVLAKTCLAGHTVEWRRYCQLLCGF